MKIQVRLFATFRHGRDKVQDLERGEGVTVQTLLDELEIDREEVALLLVNGRDGTFETELTDGDTVSLFPPVGGG